MIHATSARLFIYAGLLMVVFLTLPEMVKAGTKNTGEACVTNTDCVSNQCEQVGTGLAYCVAKKIGDVCSSGNWGDNECITGDCEDAENIAPADAYCVCQTAAHCATQYAQVDPSALNWECTDNDDDQIYDLHYCKLKSTGRLYYPVDPPPSSVTGLIGDNEATVQNAGDELKQMISAPQLRIAIPGLSFTSVDKLVQKTEADGATYMYFPFLGEYISAMYKYAIAVMGIIAVIMIIVGGVIWITSGGIPERVNQAKTIIVRSVVGMILAVGSYTLLYTINPELVQFRNLKVLLIKGDPLDESDIHGYDKNDPESAPIGEIKSIPKVTKQVGQYKYKTDNQTFVDCSSFPGWDAKGKEGAKARDECRKACLMSLPNEARTKVSNPSYKSELYTGYIDCVSKGTRDMSKVNYIVIHEGAVTGAAPLWWKKFVLEQKQLGTHYFIDRLGKVTQLLDERFNIVQSAYSTNGIGIDVDAECTSASSKPEISETCNYTDEQYNALTKLIAEIKSRLNIFEVVGHCELNEPGNGHTDPRKFDWSKIGSDNVSHRGGNCKFAL